MQLHYRLTAFLEEDCSRLRNKSALDGISAQKAFTLSLENLLFLVLDKRCLNTSYVHQEGNNPRNVLL